MAKSDTSQSNAINLIGPGTEITGDINSNSDVRVDGTLNGNLTSKGKVVIGETGKVKGEINCKNSDVSGKIEGKMTIGELLSLKPSALVDGDIITNKVSIEPGARFNGNCDMSGSEKQSSVTDFKKETKDPKTVK